MERSTPSPRDHRFQGRYYSLDDLCINCGIRLGLHQSGDVGACPSSASGEYGDPAYYGTRKTAFQLLHTKLRLPDGV